MIKSLCAFSKAEIQSGLSRVKSAEGLILQLPTTHDGRNTWLLNYGVGEEAQKLRADRNLVGWDTVCDCLPGVSDDK